MNRRSADTDLKNLYGPGIGDLLTQSMREENVASLPTESPEDYPVLALKKRKQSTLLKSILKQGGYGDLAKMVSIKQQQS